ncbi:hypothetical protein [uncultured Roseovarius sp.]|uniref:hypothetical protein n=1 Tax=uncultured Roseovarius sp. TaxID=293344 RepID=UPI0026152B29|nr:hypothetical protein [uncultured Roseovarius sp.]
MQIPNPIVRTTAALVAATLFTTPLYAGDMPNAQEIAEAVSDHTYQGSMSAGGSGFAEYYAPDGSIRGVDYSGKWRTEDGVMCFKYGDGEDRCFEVTLDGPSMVMLKDGKIDGNGMLIKGNPQGF